MNARPSYNAEPSDTVPRRRALLAFIIGQGVSNFGLGFTYVGLPLLVLEMTHSAFWVGLVSAAYSVPVVLLGLHAGLLADTFDRWRLMVASDVARLVLTALLPIALVFRSAGLPILIVLVFLVGAVNIVFQATYATVLPTVAGEDELLSANARLQFAANVGLLLGPVCAGALAVAGIALTFQVDAFSYLISLLGLWPLRHYLTKAATSAAGGTARERIKAGLRYVWGQPLLRSLSIAFFFANLAVGGFFELVVFVVRQNNGAGSLATGVVYGACAVGGALGPAVLALADRGRHNIRPLTVIRVGLLISAVCCAGMAALHTSVSVAILGCVLQAVLWAATVTSVTTRQKLAPNDMIGRVMSVSQVLAWTATPVGMFLIGSVTTVGGVTAAFIVMALLLLVPVVLIAGQHRRTDYKG